MISIHIALAVEMSSSSLSEPHASSAASLNLQDLRSSTIATATTTNQLQHQQQIWDDPFGNANNPILYMQSNRTPAYEDMRIIFIYIAFFTGYVAFLIIFPGIRQEKFSTLLSVTVSLFVGVIILTSVFGTDWQRAHATISSPYRAFSKERINADLSVKIGLKSVNITLRAHSALQQHQQQHQQHHHHHHHHHHQDAYYYNDDINYNERFYWIEPTEMRQEFHKALERGLPYPILTVAEYLSQDEGGFSWSRQYRQAGYYADQLLWMAFATWIVMNVLLCAAPKYGVYAMLTVGTIMLATNLLYWLLVPNNKHQLVIPFEGHYLTFKFGWSYWMVMIAGTTSIFIGACFLVCFKLYPHYIFTTILDIDYDNHYQHHRRLNYAPLSSSSISSPSSSAPSPINSHYIPKKQTTTTTTDNQAIKQQQQQHTQYRLSNNRPLKSNNSLTSSTKSGSSSISSSSSSESRQQKIQLEKEQLQQLSAASLWSNDKNVKSNK